MVCEAPASFLSGVQRLNSCFCFFFNCALFSALIQENIKEEHSVQHISLAQLSISLLISGVATLPQALLTLLFRFSKVPSLKLNPVLSQVCCSLSTRHLYCWLRQKRSNSSSSSEASDSSLEGSDSLYSSFEDSSIMSIPELMEESFTTEEKDGFPSALSLDGDDMIDPVSPLQKTLSTWQAFENWVKKKHDNITKPENLPIQPQKSDSALISEEIMMEELNCNDGDCISNSNDIQPSIATMSSENLVLDQNGEDTELDHSKVMHLLKNNLQLPHLHPIFYYLAWALLICNLLLSIIFVSIIASSFSFIKCLLWIKLIFIEVVFSLFIITPALITLFSLSSSLKTYLRSIPSSTIFYDQSFTDIKKNGKSPKPFYNRIEYLKRYLRPPRESALEEFRKIALKNKYILSIQSNIWKYVFIFILLLTLLHQEDTQNKYLQRTSIIKAFLRSKITPNWKTPFQSTSHLSNWLEYDFTDELFGKDQCLESGQECGVIVSTGCIPVGKGLIRIFNLPDCVNSAPNCHSSVLDSESKYLIDDNPGYHPRNFKGFHGTYSNAAYVEVLDEEKYETQEKIYHLVPYFLNNTSGAVSLEILLFNPSLSTFVSVSFLFEITNFRILLSEEVMFAKLPETASLLYHAKFSLHLLFLLIILIKCKNQCWNILNQRKVFFKNEWNYFTMLFNLVSLSYVTVYMIYSFNLQRVVYDFEDGLGISQSDVLELASFETLYGNFLTFLFFQHLIGSLQLFNYNFRLRKQMKKLLNSMKILLCNCLALLLLISLCYFMLSYFLEYSKPSHPFMFLLRCTSIFLRVFHKPEISVKHPSIFIFISAIIIFMIVTIYVIFLAFIRSVLINAKSSVHRNQEKVTVRDAGKAIKKRIANSLKTMSPQIVESNEHMPPVEFLLMELEQLADRLILKADNLFDGQDILEEIVPDGKMSSSDVEVYLRSQCQLFDKELLPKLTPDDTHLSSFKFLEDVQCEVSKCLNATMPRQAKPQNRSFMPPSLNASVASQRKFKHQTASINLSASLQSHKIRKTYPLSQVDIESSESLSEDDEPGNSFSVRKTKSRGKGKMLDLNINVLDDSFSSQ